MNSIPPSKDGQKQVQMFSSDKNIEIISQLFAELKKYAELKGKCLQIDFVSKMTILLSALIVGAILFALSTIVILFLSYTAVLFLAKMMGSITWACFLMVLFYVALGVIVYAMRRRWIVNPLANFLGRLFLSDETEQADKNL